MSERHFFVSHIVLNQPACVPIESVVPALKNETHVDRHELKALRSIVLKLARSERVCADDVVITRFDKRLELEHSEPDARTTDEAKPRHACTLFTGRIVLALVVRADTADKVEAHRSYRGEIVDGVRRQIENAIALRSRLSAGLAAETRELRTGGRLYSRELLPLPIDPKAQVRLWCPDGNERPEAPIEVRDGRYVPYRFGSSAHDSKLHGRACEALRSQRLR